MTSHYNDYLAIDSFYHYFKLTRMSSTAITRYRPSRRDGLVVYTVDEATSTINWSKPLLIFYFKCCRAKLARRKYFGEQGRKSVSGIMRSCVADPKLIWGYHALDLTFNVTSPQLPTNVVQLPARICPSRAGFHPGTRAIYRALEKLLPKQLDTMILLFQTSPKTIHPKYHQRGNYPTRIADIVADAIHQPLLFYYLGQTLYLTNSGHAVALVVDRERREVEIIDSNGITDETEIIYDYQKTLARSLGLAFPYEGPDDLFEHGTPFTCICSYNELYAPQVIDFKANENTLRYAGTCSYWTYYYIRMCLLNPGISRPQLRRWIMGRIQPDPDNFIGCIISDIYS